MQIRIDLAAVPPGVSLLDADDFTSFAVVAERVEHVYVGIAELKALAGDRAADTAWAEQLDRMLAYAESKGWIREDGAVRAHVGWS
jgi:hypothetical protein